MADYPVTQEFSGGDYGRSATAAAQPFKGIVIHVTGKPDLQSELDYMSKPDPNRPGQYGYHYLIDKDGSIYQTAPFNVRTNHILPGAGLNNSNALGVAFVGGDKGMTDAQIAAGKQLVPQLQHQFNIPTSMVMGHDAVNPDTRGGGAGHDLGVNDTGEGQQFVDALNNRPMNVYASNAAPSAGPARPVTTTPGVTLNTSPMDLVANVESGNRNIPQQIVDKNTARGTPAGGYFQIIDPTWRTYAAKAGVDLNQYPTAMSAPRNIQAQVASAIPVNQWGPTTVAALQKQFPGIDTSKTLGEVQTAALGGRAPPGPAAAAPGTTINTAAAGPSSGVLPGFGTKDASDNFLAGLKQAGVLPETDGQQSQPKPPQIMGGPGLRNYPGMAGVEAAARQLEPQLTGYSPGLYGQSLNSQPMSWGSSPIGAPPWLKAGAQQPQAQGYGTNLNSLQMAAGLSPYQLQMMMNPMMLDQG